MRLILLSVSVACAWFIVTNVAVSVAVWAFSPLLARRIAHMRAASRASVLSAWRLIPSVSSGLVAVGVAWPAFLIHETRASAEPLTWWLVLGLALTAGIVAGGGHAAWRAWRAAAAQTAAWRACARLAEAGTVIVDRGLPTAAVAGLWRPTVFVGRALRDRLTPSEFRAVLAHEWAHARARDNARRALLLGAPDLLRLTWRGTALIDAWMLATEHAADDRVACLGRAAAVDLASALVKAARIVAAPAPEPALVRSMSAHGEVSGRVIRLLDHDSADAGSLPVVRIGMLCAAVALAVVWMQGPGLSAVVHAVSEAIVNGRL